MHDDRPDDAPARRRRRRLAAVAAVVLVAAIVAVVVLATSRPGPHGDAERRVVPAGNLTANPSFEDDTTGWGSFNGRPLERTTGQQDVPDGRAVVRVAVQGDRDQYSLDDGPAAVRSTSGGRRYTATAAVRAATPGARGKTLELVIRTTRGGTSSTCAQAPVELTAAYRTVRTTCTAPASGDALDVYLRRTTDVVPGEAFFADAVTLVGPDQGRLPAGSLTTNPSFESGVAGWTAQRASAAPTPRATDPDAAAGSRTATVAVAGAASSYALRQAPPGLAGRVAGGRRYTATAWVKAGPAGDGARVTLALRETAAGGATVQVRSATVVLRADRFVPVTVGLDALRTGDGLELSVGRDADVRPGEAFRLDAVALTATSPGALRPGGSVANPSFEQGARGWTALRPTDPAPRSVAAIDAPDGARVAAVAAPDGRAFGLLDTTPVVGATAAGHTYTASAWARAGAGPDDRSRPAVLVVREIGPDGAPVRTRTSAPVDLDAARFRRLRVAIDTVRPGDRLRVSVERRDAVRPGERLLVDAVAVDDRSVAAVYGSATTIRPDDPLPAGGGPAADIAAARNESASFQVALRTAGVPRTGVRAAMTGALRGRGGATIPASAVSLYREASYDVVRVTDGEGAPGRWPDELLPGREPLTGGDGGAFPFDLARDDAAALWADVAVPQDARPGVYTGTLRITSGTGPSSAPLVDVPVRLVVRPFVLPSTSSLRSLFPVNARDVCAPGRKRGELGASAGGGAGGFAGVRDSATGDCDPTNEETWKLFARFAQLGLRDRISIGTAFPIPNEVAPSPAATVRGVGTQVDAFRRYVGPLLQGTADIGTLPGARLTSLSTWWGCIRDRPTCLNEWRRLLEDPENGLQDAVPRFLPWVCDEPFYDDAYHQTPWRFRNGRPLLRPAATPGAPTSCAYVRKIAREQWPDAPVKITTDIDDPGLYDLQKRDTTTPTPVPDTAPSTTAVDVLDADVRDYVSKKRGNAKAAKFAAFARQPGAENWAYIACGSGGCDPGAKDGDPEITSPEHDGWPSYAIDQPASQASAMGWMAFMYGFTGESYYDVAGGFNEGPRFRFSIDVFGTNGDGLLFYPGRVRLPDGSTQDTPFESIRLKRIREGREDYEYLHLLEACGRRPEGMAVAQGLFGDLDRAMFQTTVSQERLDRARQDLADLVERYDCG